MKLEAFPSLYLILFFSLEAVIRKAFNTLRIASREQGSLRAALGALTGTLTSGQATLVRSRENEQMKELKEVRDWAGFGVVGCGEARQGGFSGVWLEHRRGPWCGRHQHRPSRQLQALPPASVTLKPCDLGPVT